MGGLILVSGYFHSLVSLIDILLLPFVSTFFLPYVLDSLLTSPFLIFKILVVVGRERLIGAVCMQPELSAGLKQLLQCGPAVSRGWWNPKHSAIPDAPPGPALVGSCSQHLKLKGLHVKPLTAILASNLAVPARLLVLCLLFSSLLLCLGTQQLVTSTGLRKARREL